jgi:uncharacterized membrane protein YcfT
VATLRMPLFFCLAGMFARKWEEMPWRTLLRSKVALLAWVFIVWQVIGELVIFAGLSVVAERPSARLAIRDVLLSPIFPRLELWFLWALALFFITIRATRRAAPWLRLSLAAGASIVALSIWPNYTTGWNGFLKYFFFFLVGLQLRPVIARLSNSRVAIRIGWLAIWSVTTVVVSWLGLTRFPGVYFAVACLGVVGGVSLATLLVRLGKLAWVGKNTLPIYVAHTPLIILCTCVLHVVGLSLSGVIVYTLPPVIAALAVGCSLLIYTAARRNSLSSLYELPHLTSRRYPAAQALGHASESGRRRPRP